MFPENKQNRLSQMKKNGMKEESYLYYTTIIKYAFCVLIFYTFILFYFLHKGFSQLQSLLFQEILMLGFLEIFFVNHTICNTKASYNPGHNNLEL